MCVILSSLTLINQMNHPSEQWSEWSAYAVALICMPLSPYRQSEASPRAGVFALDKRGCHLSKHSALTVWTMKACQTPSDKVGQTAAAAIPIPLSTTIIVVWRRVCRYILFFCSQIVHHVDETEIETLVEMLVKGWVGVQRVFSLKNGQFYVLHIAHWHTDTHTCNVFSLAEE